MAMAGGDARTPRTSRGRHQGGDGVAGGACGRGAAGRQRLRPRRHRAGPVARGGPLARQGPNRRWRCVVAPLCGDMQDACRFNAWMSPGSDGFGRSACRTTVPQESDLSQRRCAACAVERIASGDPAGCDGKSTPDDLVTSAGQPEGHQGSCTFTKENVRPGSTPQTRARGKEDGWLLALRGAARACRPRAHPSRSRATPRPRRRA